MDDIRELTRRLESLERRHRNLQIFLTLVVISACAVLFMAQTPATVDPRGVLRTPNTSAGNTRPPQESEVRAEAFTLVSANGGERASLVSDGTGSVFLVLFDNKGKPRADLQVNNYGPSLNFYDPNGKPRVVVGSTTLVASHVNSGGIIERNTPSSIVLFDANGQLVWRTP